MAIQVLLAMPFKSPTCDEYAHHIASGVSYLVTGDFRMNPASPPLPRVLAALPLRLLQPKLPLDHPSWEKGDSPEFAKQFFTVYNRKLDDFIFWARVPIVLLSFLFGLSLYLWCKTLFGPWPAVAGVWLYSFCPDILAHSGLATADLCLAFFFFLAVGFFWRYEKHPTVKNLALTAVMTGGAFLSKFSAVLLLPLLLILGFLSNQKKLFSFSRATVFLGVTLLTVWAGYFFETKPLLTNTPDPVKKEAVYRRLGGDGFVHFAQNVPVPLSTFSSAFVSMMVTRSQGTNAYLMGEWSRKGWWYYYFVAFMLKNTLPFLILSLFGFYALPKLGFGRETLSVIMVPILLFFLVTLADKAQAGIRYFLPVYPFFIMLGAASCLYLWRKNAWMRGLIVALLAWHAVETARVFPDHLAYFNQLAGGPSSGYRWLRDSNLDWGQDLKRVAEYVREKGYAEVAVLSLSPVDPKEYGIPSRELTPEDMKAPAMTVYAIGAHYHGVVPWAASRTPDRVIGHSFFIYDMRRES